MIGLQTGNRDFDESYGDNHVLYFQFNPLMWNKTGSPWLGLDPPDNVRSLDRDGVQRLPLDRYLNIKFHCLLAIGPTKPNTKHGEKTYTAALK